MNHLDSPFLSPLSSPLTSPLSGYKTFALALATTVALSACGGGGDATPATASTTPSTSNSAAAGPQPPGAPATGPAASAPATGTSTALSAAKTCNLPNFQADWVKRVNDVRASGTTCSGKAVPPVAAVQWNSALFEASAAHSQDMVANNFFAHTGSDGTLPWDRMKKQGYTNGYAGENIAAGQSTVPSALDAWLTSQTGHCENIMSGNYKDFAVACVAKPDGTKYWTMDLASPQ